MSRLIRSVNTFSILLRSVGRVVVSGGGGSGNALLLETGDALLLENGDRLGLE